MTPIETVQLVGIISQIWPSMKLDEYTPDAWDMVLDDLDANDAIAAVRYLAKARSGYISPADIRRQVATAAGLLPPLEGEALVAAAEVAGRRGDGASKLHPIVREAYRAMGGATAFDAPPSVLRPQWGKVYAATAARHMDELLGGNLGQAIEQRRQHALAAAPKPALDAAPESAPTTDRRAEIAAYIRSINPPGDVDKLHSRKAWWRREQRPHRTAVANPHFAGFQKPEETA